MLTATSTPATTRPLHGSMTSASSPSSASAHHHHQHLQQTSRAHMASSTHSQTKPNPYTHRPRPSDDSSSQSSSSSSSSSEDDDVPLAAAIPGALKAQRTIRRQYREERAARKARAPSNPNPPLPPTKLSSPHASAPSSPPLASAILASGPPTNMSAVAANLMRSKTVLKAGEAPRLRPHIADQLKQRAAQAQAQATTISSPPMPPAQISPTRATHDISRRLQNTQLADPGSISSGPRQRSRSHTLNGSAQRPVIPPEAHPQTVWTEAPAVPSLDPAQLQPARTVRPVRSFHNTPPAGAAGLGRSVTTSRRRPDVTDEQIQQQSISSGGATGLGRSGTTSRRRPDPVDDQHHLQHPPSQAGATLERAKSSRTPRSVSNPTGRTSNEIDRSRTLPASSSAEASLPVPPVPTIPSSVKLVQQKIYIGDNALPHTVELAPGVTAGAVLGMLDEQGALAAWVGSGGWMLFESARDFGLERPIRTFERLEDVLASWNRDRTDNIIVARLSAMAGVLARSQVPAENVGYGGWVEYEAKRGKWSKRWLSLREGALWVGKKEGGRNGEMLVQLSNFDAYSLTKAHKAPKSGTFAIKSTESLAFFEDVGDFMHVFSLEERGAELWMQKILLARSFVILQERNQKAAAAQAPSSAAAPPNIGSSTVSAPVGGAKGLSRSGTTRRPVPAQPLVVVPPPYQQPNAVQGPPANYGFEPGTLLGRR